MTKIIKFGAEGFSKGNMADKETNNHRLSDTKKNKSLFCQIMPKEKPVNETLNKKILTNKLMLLHHHLLHVFLHVFHCGFFIAGWNIKLT